MTGLFGNKEGKENARIAREVRKMVKNKDYDAALRAATKYLDRVPHNHDMLFVAAGIHHMRGSYAKSIALLERALEIGSYDTDVLLLKADIHLERGEKVKAKECCERIFEVDEGNAAARDIVRRL